MANEFKLSFTAAEIDEKLRKVDTLGSVQSDWNQNDSSAADFIKNKPFGEGRGYIMPEQEVCDPSGEGAHVSLDEEINVGDTVTVVYDGVSYDCTALDYPDLDGGRLFGNLSLTGMEDDTGEPFVAVSMGNVGIFFLPDADSHVIGIIAGIINKLAPEYMEVLTFYVNGSDTDPYIYTDATLNNKATKEEILAASKIQNFRLEIVAMGFTAFAMPVISVPISKQTPFKVYAFDCLSEEIRIYRTAEYVPET